MNAWLIGATVLLFALIPCATVVFRGSPMDRVVGLEMAGMIEVLILILLAEGFHRIPFYDIALALALLAFGGSLVFVRFLERWL